MKLIEIYENTDRKLQFIGADYAKTLNREKILKKQQQKEEEEFHFVRDLPITRLFDKYIDNTQSIIDKADDMIDEYKNGFEQVAKVVTDQYVPKEEYNDVVGSVRDWAVDFVALALEYDKERISNLLNTKKLTKRKIREILLERKTKLILEDYLERRIDMEKAASMIKRRLNVSEPWEETIVNALVKDYRREQLKLEMAKKAMRKEEDILPPDDDELIDTPPGSETETEGDEDEEEVEPIKVPAQKPVIKQMTKSEKVQNKKKDLEDVAKFVQKQKKKNAVQVEDEEEEAPDEVDDEYNQSDDDEFQFPDNQIDEDEEEEEGEE